MDRLRNAYRSLRLRRGLAACGLLIAAAVAFADDVFRGTADLHLGATLHAAFPAPAEGPHRYTFFATQGTKVTASVQKDAGASLSPTLKITHPGGLVRKSSSGGRISGFKVPYAGYYVLEVGAKKGSGGYTLTTGGVIGKSLNGLFPQAPSGDEYFSFDSTQGVVMSVKIAPKHGGPLMEITGVTTPSGATLPVLPLQNGATSEVQNVPLPEDGTYQVTFTNHGTPGDLKLTFKFQSPPAQPGVHELGVSSGIATTTIELGDPTLAARSGYVGSAKCGRCHDTIVRSWSDTAHNSAVRAWNRAGLAGLSMVNDANGNGVDDFKDGLDLATTPAFAAYGANAPKLLYVAGDATPYKVRIGAVTYVVDRTMGGNGLWVQRYLAPTGQTSAPVGVNRSPLPFEFDEKTRTYAAYRPQDWYDAENNPLPAPSASRTFEAQCSGCHNTGETLQANGAAVSTGYVEMNIGCEQCHGPGAAHAANGDTRKILNPRDLVADSGETAANSPNVAKANDVCARCHTRGSSVDPVPGTQSTAEFGFKGGQVAHSGDATTDFLVPTQDPADFWGFKTNPLPTVPGDTSVAARSDRNHGQDIANGEHTPVEPHAAACFDCHDPHSRVTEHMIKTSVTNADLGVRVVTTEDDNSLCLACHSQRPGDVFEALPRSEAALIYTDSKRPAVASAVLDHMRDIGMPVRTGFYDPLGTGVGRCVACHMTLTGVSGATTVDKGGFAEGGLHSHRFEIVWPRASALYGVTNSCNTCHPTAPEDQVGPILTQWANAAKPGQTAFHGAAPPTSQDGIALNMASNPSHTEGERRCISCHTAEGFVQLRVFGDRDQMPQDEVDKIAKETVAQDRGVSCDACHGRRADGNFYGVDANPLRMDKTQLCDACHNAETVTFPDFRDHGAVVRHPQSEMLAGTAGDPPPGAPPTATTSHSFLPDRCITCHFDADHALGKHDFLPNTGTCASCHPGLNTFDRPAKGDYDGNGVVSGIQTEVSGLLDILKAALLADPLMTFANGRFDYDGGTDHALTGASETQKRAVFNWYSVDDDKSRGVHNAARAVQLLQKSYKELTGVDVPGAVIR
jgi:hypothetical protein